MPKKKSAAPDNPPSSDSRPKHRRLILVLGDQLDPASAVFDDADPTMDTIWMAEVAEESEHVWTHKARIAVFLSAMRHFAAARRAEGWTVYYQSLDDANASTTLAGALTATLHNIDTNELVMVEAGEYRVEQALQATARQLGAVLTILPDRHFFTTRAWFTKYCAARKQLRMEYFYREMRRENGVLLTEDGEPEGGQWNFDADNRESFSANDRPRAPAPRRFLPDDITLSVLSLVEQHFPDHPGKLEDFDWPVTPADAEAALEDFLEHRLPQFGRFQDAMWTNEPWLYHSRLSVALNLKLVNPRRVVAAAERAYRDQRAPLNAVEGFIRQILGWREYVRGIYWTYMPDYLERNALGAEENLPGFYWTGSTDMNCLRDTIGQTLRYGYAHHIQRLMITGLFALLYGVRPQEVHAWYLAVYVDAVEWVELPNTLGMSQYGDGGVMASKPYAASGKYIQRMSNYCDSCRYDPSRAEGPNACPFTTLYWDFLLRHQETLATNQRIKLQVNNAKRKSAAEQQRIQVTAEQLRASLRNPNPRPPGNVKTP